MSEAIGDWLRELAERRGVDLSDAVSEADAVDASSGWVLPDPLAYRKEMTERLLATEFCGEFAPHRLPPLDHRVAKWIDQQKVAPQEAPFLLIIGGTGAGKTSQGAHCVIDLARHAANSGRPLRWWFLPHRTFVQHVHWSEADADAVLERYQTCDLLLFDDLGDFHLDPQGHGISRTNELIDYRYHRQLPTIFTTNLLFKRSAEMVAAEARGEPRVKVLMDVVDERVLSRIRQGWQLHLGTTDHRVGAGRVLR